MDPTSLTLALLGLSGAALATTLAGDGGGAAINEMSVAAVAPPVKPKQFVLAGSFAAKRPLPPQAIAAYSIYSRTKNKSDRLKFNNLHHDEQWFRFASWSKGWQRKLAHMKFYAKPPGANHIESTSKNFNLAWMAQAPSAWYPRYGFQDKSCRVSVLKSLIGPKSDLKTLFGGYKDLLAMVPDVAAAAGMVGGAVASGGASAAKDPSAIISSVEGVVRDVFGVAGGVIKDTKKRTKAAQAIVQGLGSVYIQRLEDANPHAVKNGKLDLGANYMANPRTYGDLSRAGNARPLLFNPKRLKA